MNSELGKVIPYGISRHRVIPVVLALLLAVSLLSVAGPVSAASSGQACKKVGLTATSKSGKKTTYLLCAKVGTKLLWVNTKPPTTTTTTTTTVPPFSGGSCARVGAQKEVTSGSMSVSLLCSKVGTKNLWVEVSSKQNYTCDALGVRAPSSSSSCQVGDTGPGNGIVFYVATTPFIASGTTCNTACRYLEAAPNTWNGGSTDPYLVWSTRFLGCYGYLDALANCESGSIYPSASAAASRTAAVAIGMGMANTTAIVARHGVDTSPYAAGMVDSLTFGGQSDWYLPSKDELNQLYIQKSAVGGFANKSPHGTRPVYWSSSEHVMANQWGETFDNGDQHFSNNGYAGVRPIRAF